MVQKIASIQKTQELWNVPQNECQVSGSMARAGKGGRKQVARMAAGPQPHHFAGNSVAPCDLCLLPLLPLSPLQRQSREAPSCVWNLGEWLTVVTDGDLTQNAPLEDGGVSQPSGLITSSSWAVCSPAARLRPQQPRLGRRQILFLTHNF